MKFARLENLSDSEEAEMDVSSSDDDQEAHPRKKRAPENDTASSAESVAVVTPAPKWSNPDPYTALPPPDESQNKKVDVVKLIRKARLAASAAQAAQTDAVVSNEDFISLAGLVDENESNRAPENAPAGPRAGNRKRTRDDEMKGSAKSIGKLGSRYPQDGLILEEWKSRHSESGSPWLTPQPTLSVGSRYVQSLTQNIIAPF
jgi:non-canonical poly(A) RNA polymerase PAPD5/7